MAAAVAVLVVVPVAAAWVMVASLKAHAVIRDGKTIERWRLVRTAPRVSLADPADFSTRFGAAAAGGIADPRFDALPRPFVVTTGIVSLPPKPSLAAVDVIPLPPVNPVLPAREPPKSVIARAAPHPAGVRLASAAAVAAVPRHERRAGQDALNALTQHVRPAIPDPRRDDIVGSVSAYNNPDLPRFATTRTAIYDIAAHTVYMPNGERLEAHSGLGSDFDDPRSVRVRNRGVTPPNVYDLRLRERLFHGVAALRLNPRREGDMFGRAGILAHSYMLGSRGDSNGCVSFKEYARFLQAFRHGEVSRLIVVTHMTGSPASVVARADGSERYAANGKPARARAR